MSSRFVRYCEPNPCDAERSRSRSTVRSRSSVYFLTCGTPVRAVTFQSIVLTSSPGTYSRTSENSIPRPRKTEWYSPPTPASTRRFVRMRMRWSLRTMSRGSIGGEGATTPGARAGAVFRQTLSSRDFHSLQESLHDLVARHVLGLGLVGEEDTVTQHVRGDVLHVLRHDVAATGEEGTCAGRGEERE